MDKERKVQIPWMDGTQKPGVDLDIEESSEKWSELKLADGSRIRLKQIATQVVRLDNMWDNEGNPVYFIKSTPMMSVASAPDYLKKNGGMK